MLPRHTLFAIIAVAVTSVESFAADDAAFMDQVRQDIGRLQELKRARTAPQRKVASTLLAEARARKFGRVSDALPDLESGVDVDLAGSVSMDLKANVSPGLIAEINRLGGIIEYSHAGSERFRLFGYGLVQTDGPHP